MQLFALLGRLIGRPAGVGAVVLLAAAGAITAASAEVALGSPFGDPVPAIAPVPEPVVMPSFVFSSPMPGFSINSRFGFRKLPGEKGRMHEGVDYAAPTGAPIECASEGTVVRSALSPTYGNFVEVDHGDGVTTFYAHMSRRAAKPGEVVKAGEVLGYVGATGHVTGPHLHFEVRKNEQQFDPMRVLGRTFASLEEIPFAGRLARAARATRATATPAAPVPYTVIGGRVRSRIG